MTLQAVLRCHRGPCSSCGSIVRTGCRGAGRAAAGLAARLAVGAAAERRLHHGALASGAGCELLAHAISLQQVGGAYSRDALSDIRSGNSDDSGFNLRCERLYRGGKLQLAHVLSSLAPVTDGTAAMCHCSNMAAMAFGPGIKMESIDRRAAGSACVSRADRDAGHLYLHCITPQPASAT